MNRHSIQSLLYLIVMKFSIVAILATAKYSTHCAIVVALAVFLYAMGLPAFTAFLHLLDLHPQTETLVLVILTHLLLEAMGITG